MSDPLTYHPLSPPIVQLWVAYDQFDPFGKRLATQNLCIFGLSCLSVVLVFTDYKFGGNLVAKYRQILFGAGNQWLERTIGLGQRGVLSA